MALTVVAYLHWRVDLSDFGIRPRGWKGNVVAVLFLGLLSFAPMLLRPDLHSFTPGKALLPSLDRLFANPALST